VIGRIRFDWKKCYLNLFDLGKGHQKDFVCRFDWKKLISFDDFKMEDLFIG